MAGSATAKRHGRAHLVSLEAGLDAGLESGDTLAPHEIIHASGHERLTVDEWGRDARLVRALAPLASLRWDVSVGGVENVGRGAALLVVNTRRLALTPIYTAWALSNALDRPVRFAGRPDMVPFGPVLRRVGGLLAQPAEIAGALRAGEVVVVGAAGTANPRHAGSVDHALIAPARAEGVPIHAAATLSAMVGRHARVEIGAAVQRSGTRRGPLAELELAEQVQLRLQAMLDELGPTRADARLPGWGLLAAIRART